MSTVTSQATSQVAPSPVVREDDIQSHIEDTDLVSAIRAGHLIQVSWNQLSPDEQRAAYRNMFLASGLY